MPLQRSSEHHSRVNGKSFDDSLPFEVTICAPDLDSKPMKFCMFGDQLTSLMQSRKSEDVAAVKRAISYIDRRYAEICSGQEKPAQLPVDKTIIKAINIWVARVMANEADGSLFEKWTVCREMYPNSEDEDKLVQQLVIAEKIQSTTFQTAPSTIQTIICLLVANQKEIHGADSGSGISTEAELFKHIHKWCVSSTSVEHCTVWPFLPKGVCIRYAYAAYLARADDSSFTPYDFNPLGVESTLWGHSLMEADNHYTFNEKVGRLHSLTLIIDYLNAVDGHVAYGPKNIIDWCKDGLSEIPLWNRAMVLQQLDMLEALKVQRNEGEQNPTFADPDPDETQNGDGFANVDQDIDIDSLRWMDASVTPIFTAWCKTRNWLPFEGPPKMSKTGCDCCTFAFNAWYRVHDLGDLIPDVCYDEMMNENRLWWGSCRSCNLEYARAVMQFPLLVNSNSSGFCCPLDDEHRQVTFVTVAAHVFQIVVPRYNFFLQLWRLRNCEQFGIEPESKNQKCQKNCNWSFIYGKRQRRPLEGDKLMQAFSDWATHAFGVKTHWGCYSVPQAHQRWSQQQNNLCPHQKICSNFVKWFQAAVERVQTRAATVEEAVAMQSTLFSEFRIATECACPQRNGSSNRVLQSAIYAVVLTNDVGWDVVSGKLHTFTHHISSNGHSR